MRSLFGNPYILVGEGAPKLSWWDKVETSERSDLEAREQKRREECRKLVEKARQEALKNILKRPKKSRRTKGGEKRLVSLPKARQQEKAPSRPSCKARGKLWNQELSSLTALVGAITFLLSVITPSEASELPGLQEACMQKQQRDTGSSAVLDYWAMVPFLLVIMVMMTIRVREYLVEMKMAKETPILHKETLKEKKTGPLTVEEGSRVN
jgi:hypothetical protein